MFVNVDQPGDIIISLGLIVPMFTRVAESVVTLVGGLRRTYCAVAELARDCC